MKKLLTLVIFILIFFEISCGSNVNYLKIDFVNYFDTDGYIILEYQNGDDYSKIKEDIYNSIITLLTSLENTFSGSDTKTESLVQEINNNAGTGKDTLINEDLTFVLKKAKYYHNLSKNFDVTIGSLTYLWDISNQSKLNGTSAEFKIPSVLQINEAKALVDMDKIELTSSTIYLEDSGMKLDFGAIAKGYAVDKIQELLINKLSVDTFFIINFGGSVLINGNRTTYEKRFGKTNVVINTPNNETEELLKVFIEKSNIVSSSDLERYITIDGVKYSHILSPITGYPIDTDIDFVSIIGDTNIDCDALSTITYMEGFSYANKLEELGFSYVIVTKDKKIYISPDLNIELINQDYTIVK